MTLREYAEYALNRGAKCWCCHGQLKSANIRHYEHDGGWEVDRYAKRQWLFFVCPKYSCRYQTSFAAFGIPR